MIRTARSVVLAAVVVTCAALDAAAQAPIAYRLSFPEREHHLLTVEATFPDLPKGPLQLRMSRSSPGRYSSHDFAKNVFDVRVTNASGQPLPTTRPNPHQWDVAAHPSVVRVTYRVFGDRVDGTYLGIDTTHAHINMPAAIMWARGLELRPVTVRFEPPPGSGWRVATQLLPGADPLTFTAGTLQYLIDSPAELSAFALRTFTMADGPRTPIFRLAVHQQEDDSDLDAFARDVQRIVREERGVFGEFPAYEGNSYTFICDYLPWIGDDGMEHRNSTVLASPGSIRTARRDLLGTVAHEFFHGWNVERIRPRSLEPFNLEDVNISGELWLGEGFTNYYGALSIHRAGLTTVADFVDDLNDALVAVLANPARRVHTVEEMSRLAAFTDEAVYLDPVNTNATFISYYSWGEALALALDLSLRDRTSGRVTLDDFMRAMWDRFGKPISSRAGYVDHPYTSDDAQAVLASVAGDASFAQQFFARYVQGHDIVDYAALLNRAGFLLRKVAPGQPYAGVFSIQNSAAGARVASVVPFDSPAYRAGLDLDDVIVEAGGAPIASADDFLRALRGRRAGDLLPIAINRRGQRISVMLPLEENPIERIVPAEEAGQVLTDAQKQFRAAWLSSVARNVF
jgi:predicted metalloprotease with PDZ domain